MTSLHQQPRLLRSSLEGITSFSRLNPSIQCIDKSLNHGAPKPCEVAA